MEVETIKQVVTVKIASPIEETSATLFSLYAIPVLQCYDRGVALLGYINLLLLTMARKPNKRSPELDHDIYMLFSNTRMTKKADSVCVSGPQLVREREVNRKGQQVIYIETVQSHKYAIRP